MAFNEAKVEEIIIAETLKDPFFHRSPMRLDLAGPYETRSVEDEAQIFRQAKTNGETS